MTRKTYLSLILILGSLTALTPFTVDMYLPGFSKIAADMHTSPAQVALSLSSFFIGISLGQLGYGPLLDRFGRKRPLYAGLCLFILASVACSWAVHIEELILLRFVQAIGSCSAGVASMAMVRDLFPVKDSAKVFSLLMLMVGLSPMLAPTIGGYVTAAFGWQGVFLTLAAMGLLVLLASLAFLPDSYRPDPQASLHPRSILSGFKTVLGEPSFYTYAFSGAIAFGGLFAYVASSPLVFMEVFHVNEKTYGWIFAFLSIAFIGASQVNTWLLSHYSSEQIIRVALLFMCLLTASFIVFIMAGWASLYSTLIFLFVYLSFLGLINPNAAALALAPFSKQAGSASALLGAAQMSMGTLASFAVSFFHRPSPMPMVVIMGVCSLLAWVTLRVGKKKTMAL